MRINVYTEELTEDVCVVSKEGIGDDGNLRIFHGLRFYLHSPDSLHSSPTDDDRSAVTFWGLRKVQPLLEKALDMLKNKKKS